MIVCKSRFHVYKGNVDNWWKIVVNDSNDSDSPLQPFTSSQALQRATTERVRSSKNSFHVDSLRAETQTGSDPIR